MESDVVRPPWLTLEGARSALVEGRGAGVRIAVIDSGIEVGHPRLLSLALSDDIQIVDNGMQIEVREGDGAQQAFLELRTGVSTQERAKALRAALLRYCKHDTWVMVILRKFLCGEAAARGLR